jgi:hypothetical protein
VELGWPAGLRRVERGGREIGLSPKTEGFLFSLFSKFCFILFPNSFAF